MYNGEKIHSELPPCLYEVTDVKPLKIVEPHYINPKLLMTLGFDNEVLKDLNLFTPLKGSFEKPLALQYHGCKYGEYNADMGDGRGFLHAQIRGNDGYLYDISTKGSGVTPLTRKRLDGRLSLKEGVREVLASTMLDAMGVNTSQSLVLWETEGTVKREEEPSPARTSLLVRASRNSIRIGTFEYLNYNKKYEEIQKLIDHLIKYYFVGCDSAASLYDAIVQNIARMGGEMMAAGFVHGSLHTDNINIMGEVFDFGSWRFMHHFYLDYTGDILDPEKNYAYYNQPKALYSVLKRLGNIFKKYAGEESIETSLLSFDSALFKTFNKNVLFYLGLKDDVIIHRILIKTLMAVRIPWAHFMFDMFGGGIKSRLARSQYSSLYEDERVQTLITILNEVDRLPNLEEAKKHDYFRRKVPTDMYIGTVEQIWDDIDKANNWFMYQTHLNQLTKMKEAYDLLRV
jgi:serine/tyrosine/threonine adenylyltransferase